MPVQHTSRSFSHTFYSSFLISFSYVIQGIKLSILNGRLYAIYFTWDLMNTDISIFTNVGEIKLLIAFGCVHGRGIIVWLYRHQYSDLSASATARVLAFWQCTSSMHLHMMDMSYTRCVAGVLTIVCLGTACDGACYRVMYASMGRSLFLFHLTGWIPLSHSTIIFELTLELVSF